MHDQIYREDPSGLLNPRQTDGALIGITLVGCISGFSHFLNKAALHSPSFLIDGYWASFYEMSYADGYRRRALVGSALRWAEPKAGSVVVINVFAALVVAALLTIYIVSFLRKAEKGAWSYLFTFAFFSSALISIFFEVMGDLLQPALLLFLLGGWCIATRVRMGALRMVLAVLLLIPCFLIHEAAVFFILPCLPFLLSSRPAPKHFLLPLILLIMFMAWSTAWGKGDPHLTYHLQLLHGATQLDTKETLGTPSFGQLLHQLYVVHFGGFRGKINFVIKVLKVGTLAIGGWIAAAIIFDGKTLAKQLYIYMVLVIFSIPFLVIAADWGRFTAYYFFLAIVISCWHPTSMRASEGDPKVVIAMVRELQWVTGSMLVRITGLLALIDSPFSASRIYGMDLRDLLCTLFIGLFAIAQLKGWLRQSEPVFK